MTVGEMLITGLVIALLGAFVGGLLIQYTLEFWLSRMKDKPIDVSYGICCVGGLFLGWNIGIPAAFITWIASMALE